MLALLVPLLLAGCGGYGHGRYSASYHDDYTYGSVYGSPYRYGRHSYYQDHPRYRDRYGYYAPRRGHVYVRPHRPHVYVHPARPWHHRHRHFPG